MRGPTPGYTLAAAKVNPRLTGESQLLLLVIKKSFI